MLTSMFVPLLNCSEDKIREKFESSSRFLTSFSFKYTATKSSLLDTCSQCTVHCRLCMFYLVDDVTNIDLDLSRDADRLLTPKK